MYLFPYPPPASPDVLELGRLYEAQLRKQIDTMHKRSVAFIETARAVLELAHAYDFDEASWGYNEWAGLYVRVALKANQGFDAVFPLHSFIADATTRLATFDPKTYGTTVVADPKPEDCADVRRRSWTFVAGKARMSLMATAHHASEVCKLVEVGTQPKFEMQCTGTPIPGLTAPIAPQPAPAPQGVDLPF